MSWICKRCETENSDTTDICEVCESPREIMPSYLTQDVHFEFCDAENKKFLEWISKAISLQKGVADFDYFLSKYNDKAYRDIIRYAPYLLMSAEKGDKESQFRIGLLLMDYPINGCKANSFIWFSRAANQGNAYAMEKLATCYENGIGIEKDLAEAKKWFERALNKGCGVARTGLLRVEQSLSVHKMSESIVSAKYSAVSSSSRKSIITFDYTARYYIKDNKKSVSGLELVMMGLPNGTLVRKMLTDEWFPIESIIIPKPHISDTAYYYAWGMKGVYKIAQLRSMHLSKSHLIKKMLTDRWFPIGD